MSPPSTNSLCVVSDRPAVLHLPTLTPGDASHTPQFGVYHPGLAQNSLAVAAMADTVLADTVLANTVLANTATANTANGLDWLPTVASTSANRMRPMHLSYPELGDPALWLPGTMNRKPVSARTGGHTDRAPSKFTVDNISVGRELILIAAKTAGPACT